MELLKYLFNIWISSGTLFSINNLRVTKVAVNSVPLNWKKINDATNYKTYRVFDEKNYETSTINKLAISVGGTSWK